jgi:hypothetical protein
MELSMIQFTLQPIEGSVGLAKQVLPLGTCELASVGSPINPAQMQQVTNIVTIPDINFLISLYFFVKKSHVCWENKFLRFNPVNHHNHKSHG